MIDFTQLALVFQLKPSSEVLKHDIFILTLHQLPGDLSRCHFDLLQRLFHHLKMFQLLILLHL
ncbi:hypothetical protein Hanom_Chr13g01196151 [Helianthus anomalus]